MPGDIDAYLALVTSQHRDKTAFINTLTTILRPVVDNAALTSTIPGLFDIDTAVGLRLDVVGEWVGRSRDLRVPLTGVYFSFDTEGLGFDQGAWKGPFDPATGLVSLPDETYRTLLRATVAANQWSGSIPDAYAVWEIVFGDSRILIQDGGDMTMLFALVGPSPDAATRALLTGGYLSLKPAGVRIAAYLIPTVPDAPFFGFDADTDAVGGFDVGGWGEPLTPT